MPARSLPSTQLSDEQAALLVALQQGALLKVHRTVDGEKVYRLQPEQTGAAVQAIAPALVDRLIGLELLQSNMKFPAATFLLTDAGVALARQLSGTANTPIGPRNYR